MTEPKERLRPSKFDNAALFSFAFQMTNVMWVKYHLLDVRKSAIFAASHKTRTLNVGFYLQEDLWKLSSDKGEVFFLFIAIYSLISTQTYCNQRVKSAGH